MDRLLSVVVSVYNEEKALEEFYRETTKVLRQISWDYELLFVNDGSRDGSQDILDRLAASDSRVRVISFSRNFGHEAAMIAGLDYSRGDGIICMDADLQHPRSVYRISWLSLRKDIRSSTWSAPETEQQDW